MSADVANRTLSSSQTANPLKAARASLISAFLALDLPCYPAFPSPSDHEGFAGHIRQAAQLFDDYLAAIGEQVRDNAVTSIDGHMFAGSFLGAVDGNETGICENQAEALREFASERRGPRGGW